MNSNFDLKRYPTPEALAEKVAAVWLAAVCVAARAGRRQLVALSGGRIAKSFFEATTKLACSGAVSLRNVEIFWADERCVPTTSEDSNYLLAKKHLIDPLTLNPVHVHPLCDESGNDVSGHAEERLRAVAAVDRAGVPEFDVVFLGMGEDGHVASLFPGEDEAARSSPRIFRQVTASKPPPRRITIGYQVLAAAREVWVLASGAGKAPALEESLRHDGDTPLARVIQSRLQTRIHTDI